MASFQRFIDSRRSDQTKTGYARNTRLFVQDPDAFLELARAHKSEAEDRLIDAIAESKGRLAATTISVRLIMLKSFLDFYEVPLNWKRVRQTAPRARMVSQDRAPTLEEVRRVFDFCLPREKVTMLFMLSGGLRVGAFEYLDAAHVRKLDSGVGLVRVYAGEPEEYSTFVSVEAMQALDAYMKERERRASETVGPGSPLIRDREYQQPRTRRLSTKSIQSEVWRAWLKSGVTTKGVKAEFKMDHGFRKFFKTNFPACPMHGDLDKEVLLGHYLHYHKPSLEHLEEVYLKALPYLAVDERFRLKVELERKDEEHRSEWQRTRLDLLEAKERMREQDERLQRMEAWVRLWSENPEAAKKALAHSKPSPPSV